jgi:hypothetical protein
VSDTLGDGNTEKDAIILSGYSSRIFDTNRVPKPEPVPPPNEWVNWKPNNTNNIINKKKDFIYRI